MRHEEGFATTLCFNCVNAVNGCSWAREFKPVDGWTAKKTQIGNSSNYNHRIIDSYYVTECPLFQYGLSPLGEGDIDAYIALAHAIVSGLVEEYKNALRQTERDGQTGRLAEYEKIFMSEYFGNISVVDGERLMEIIKKMS